MFTSINLVALPVWAVWILLPNSRAARALADTLVPQIVLAILYLGCVAMSATEPTEGASFASLEGVMAVFDGRWATVAGWTHYLCFDLFVGRWIVREAPEMGWARSPFLLLTLMYGPIGLLAWLGLGARLSRRADS